MSSTGKAAALTAPGLLAATLALCTCAGGIAAQGTVIEKSTVPPPGYAVPYGTRYYVELRDCPSASTACANAWYPVRFSAYARAEPGSYLTLSPADFPGAPGKISLERVRRAT